MTEHVSSRLSFHENIASVGFASALLAQRNPSGYYEETSTSPEGEVEPWNRIVSP